ncbi:MAG: hypothetical protein R3B84_10455 [Zavarzinella sp.]
MAVLWKIAIGVSTPLGLLGLAIAVAFFLYSRRLKFKERTITSLPEDERSSYVNERLAARKFSVDNLTREQKVKVLLEDIAKSHDRFRLFAISASIVFIVCFLIASISVVFLTYLSSSVNKSTIEEPLKEDVSKPRKFEISAFEFSEDYQKNDGISFPQFDLQLRNPMSEPVVLTHVRFNIKKVWKLRLTEGAMTLPTASILLPSQFYDVGDFDDSDEPIELKSEIGFSVAGKNADPKIATFSQKVSHIIKSGEADRLVFNYRVGKFFSLIDPSSGLPVRQLCVTHIYCILLSVSLRYNNGHEIESGDLLFPNYYKNTIEQLTINNQKDIFGSREEWVGELMNCIQEINSTNAGKSPALTKIVSLANVIVSDSK